VRHLSVAIVASVLCVIAYLARLNSIEAAEWDILAAVALAVWLLVTFGAGDE
jgi:hypothetical protein